MQFHETVRGSRFFEFQLPQLIKVLTRIADALEKANPHDEKTCTSLLNEKLQEILNDSGKAETFGDVIRHEIMTDDEPSRKVGFYTAKAIEEGNVDELMLALCGWSVETLISKAEKEIAENEDE